MNSINVPWGAWYGDTRKKLNFPENAELHLAAIPSQSLLETKYILQGLNKIYDILKKKNPKSTVVVIDDLTRPIKMEPIITELLNILRSYTEKPTKITFLVGGGGHRPLSIEDVAKKIGNDAVNNYTVVNHNPSSDLCELPFDWKGTPIRMNKRFIEADMRIVISGLVPHSFAGFSGGAKMLFPGIADIEIIKRTHKSVLMGFMGKLGEVEGNRFRGEIEKLTLEIGVDFFIGLIGNEKREVIKMFCGDIVAAHRSAANYAKQFYTVSMDDDPFDVVLLNGYPKDTELLQVENAFIPINSTKKKLVKENGVIIVTSACSEGLGHHKLFGPGEILYRPPRPKRFLENKELLVFSENISLNDFRHLFHEDYLFFNNWDDIKDWLEQFFKTQFRVLVFPCASLQMVS